ncbi:MAG TPA: serine/threonine-protein kinase, partial [Candidatus Thermoplasmatota archaeon]|nr:serine/threonine-protein kinase [Candidatus Thermoplasmatota archaeon]
PALVYQGPMVFNGHVLARWGPLFAPLAILPFFLALCVALLVLDGARRASTTARAGERVALFAAGLATFTAFAVANNFSFYAAELAFLDRLPLTRAYFVIFGALTAFPLVIGARALVDAVRAPSAKLRRPATMVALATLVPLAWGLAEGVIAYFLLPRFNTIGLWRLAGVALIAYALARARLPDLAPRSRRAVATALGVGAAAGSGALAVGVFMLLTPGTPLVVLAATVIPLAALSPSVRLAHRALHVGARPDVADATLPARIETYRAALEAALARASLKEDERFLAALRHELGISDDVHEALLCIARESLLPPPDASHPGYERLRLLGEGAHGRAWLARRHADDALVVLKEPRDQGAASREALARQAKLAQRVRHPRLVRIHRLVETPRGAFLVMDHMAGGSLATRLEAGPLPAAEAARVVLDVLDGLAALHDAGVAHGDVKAANVLLDAQGRAHLADFGLARAHDAEATLTFAGAQGTLAAMAPEQLSGAPATRASDLYAAGALLYRLASGEHYLPFTGLDETRARTLVLEAPPRLPHPRVPAPFEPLLRRALAKEPAQRFADAREMRAALEDAASRL